MNYEFPHIFHISQIEQAVKNRNQYIRKDDDEHDISIFMYLITDEETFPKIKDDEDAALLRECRGITFRKSTGCILSRKFHKFFNLNEKDETQIDQLNFDQSHFVLDKLDGSMITPLVWQKGVTWCTKMGVTDVAKSAAGFANQNEKYTQLAIYASNNHFTPIFEWCSRRNRIIIDYPQEDLVLLAARHNHSGEYFSRHQLEKLSSDFDVSIVDKHDSITDIAQFVDYTSMLSNKEGFVVQFDDGHMIKLKAKEYVNAHRMISYLDLEKNVVKMILSNQLDDVYAVLDEKVTKVLKEFQNIVVQGITEKAKKLQETINNFKAVHGEDRKKFYIDCVSKSDTVTKRVIMYIWEGQDALEALKTYMMKMSSTQTKVDEIRFIWGDTKWLDLYTRYED